MEGVAEIETGEYETKLRDKSTCRLFARRGGDEQQPRLHYNEVCQTRMRWRDKAKGAERQAKFVRRSWT